MVDTRPPDTFGEPLWSEEKVEGYQTVDRKEVSEAVREEEEGDSQVSITDSQWWVVWRGAELGIGQPRFVEMHTYMYYST